MNTEVRAEVAVNEVNEIVSGQIATVQISENIKHMFSKADFAKQYEKTEVAEDGTEVTYHVRQFKLANPRKDMTAITVQDKSFIESAEKVLAVGDIKNATDFVVYRELYKLSINDVIPKTSFKTYNALASALFGISTSYASSYSKVGKYFVTDEYHLVDERLEGYKGAHLMELLPLVNREEEDIKKAIAPIFILLNNSTITTSMSTKAVRKAVREFLDGTNNESNESDEKAGKKKTSKEIVNNLNQEVNTLKEENKSLADVADMLASENKTAHEKLKQANEQILVLTDISKMGNLEIANRIMSDLLELKSRGIKVTGMDKVITALEKIEA